MEYISLSRRHLDCLGLVSSGADAVECARVLGLSVSTIEEILEEARLRLGATSVRWAARMAKELGILEGVAEAIPSTRDRRLG